jgi:hypothetical protein
MDLTVSIMRDGSSLFSAKHNGGSSRNRLPICPKVVFHWPPAEVSAQHYTTYSRKKLDS